MSTTMTLLELRTAIRQRADMVSSTFVSDAELTSYVNQSYFELYDLLITTYEDYYSASPLVISTDGVTVQYPLPDGTLYSAAPAFYKLLGVDLGLSNSANAWVTLKKFDFIERNRFLYPQLNSTYLGVFNLRYRLVGNTLMFTPTPSGGQFLRLWYIPRLTTLSADGDTADGISGWTEYIICDGAIKCGQKEETDVSILMAQKQALIKRIEETAMNRDVGQPDTVSDTRSWSDRWGGGSSNGGGSFGGF
jgi:hypothetical protein